MAESQKNLDDIVKPPNLNPPIIMKIDAPIEDSHIEENEDNEKIVFPSKLDPIKICAPTIFKPNLNSANPFISMQNKLSRGILKPPQLSFNTTSTTTPLSANKTSFTLNPSRLNPFATKPSDNSDKQNNSQPTNGELPKFVPLVDEKFSSNSTSTPSKTSNATATSTFVFGQNLQERVLAAAQLKLAGDSSSSEPKATTSNGTPAEMLFSVAAKNDAKTVTNKPETKSLSESAREYEESRASKRKYEEVEVKTGEEAETNILSTSCKLFSFDKGSLSWQERGRGTLRLNDFELEDGHTQSRLVFRTSGSLRVILNTMIWAEQTIEQASEKSIRLTAIDANGEIKVFLITATIEDAKHLFSHLKMRLQKEVTSQKRKKVDSEPEMQ